MPNQTTPKKRTVKRVSKAAAKAPRRAAPTSSMSAEHKQALAVGREEGRAIRQYLEALDANKPRRGRKRTPFSISTRLAKVEELLAGADPLSRVHLVQERIDLQAQLENAAHPIDLDKLEKAFVRALPGYASRKGLSYTAWREAGVDAAVLKRAGLTRARG